MIVNCSWGVEEREREKIFIFECGWARSTVVRMLEFRIPGDQKTIVQIRLKSKWIEDRIRPTSEIT
jgi:hypothetical protein